MKKDSLTSLNNLLNFLLMFAEYLIKVFCAHLLLHYPDI